MLKTCVSLAMAGVLAVAVAGCKSDEGESKQMKAATQPAAATMPGTTSDQTQIPATMAEAPKKGVETVSNAAAGFPADYKGTPYTDEKVKGGAQKIPGAVMCAYYDLGGEGVAYHDTTEKNLGSGGLNPLDGSYLNEFRHTEGVDTSYTKYGIGADNSPYNKVTPPDGLLYVGWTEPAEWFCLTVDVEEAGTYAVDILYTCNHGGEIAIDVNGKAGDAIAIPSTFDAADKTDWRQWHHWNVTHAELVLPKGKTLLKVHVVKEGQMNLCTMTFKKK